MTNKLEISRELAERLLSGCSVASDYDELRALLAAEPSNKCGRCGASTVDGCNYLGCHFLESGNGAPVVERQPVAWPKLEAPAMVGCTRFSKGVSSRLVVEAAQRHHEYEVTPEKEVLRIERGSEFLAKLHAIAEQPAPVVERQEPVPEYFVAACDKFDWTPEDALRFYADGKHFDIENGRTRILDSGAIASYALKNLNGDYAKLKGAEQPAPVAAINPELGSTPEDHMRWLLDKVVNPGSYPQSVLHEQIRSTLACLDKVKELNQ